MEPEIARRCKSCGAAIRVRSAFCPQCGVPQSDGGASAARAGGTPVAAAPESPTQRLAETAPGIEIIAPKAQAEAGAKTEAPVSREAALPEDVRGKDAAKSAVENTPPVVAASAPATPVVAPVDGAGGKRQRVSSAATTARDAFDDGARPRAEKLRRASNVVIDEAAADPSLRFVLVATALIIISLLLLLLARLL